MLRCLPLMLACAVAQDKPGELVPVLKKDGDHSRIEAREYHRVTSPQDWEALWERHAGKKEKPPAVDFGKHMVLAVFEGRTSTQNCGWPGLKAVRSGNGMTVLYGRCGNEVPGPSRTPYCIRVVERGEGRIVVRERQLHQGAWTDDPVQDLKVFEAAAAKK